MTLVYGDGYYFRIQGATPFSQNLVPKVPCLLEYGLGCCQNDAEFALRDLVPYFLRAIVTGRGNDLDTAFPYVLLLTVSAWRQFSTWSFIKAERGAIINEIPPSSAK